TETTSPVTAVTPPGKQMMTAAKVAKNPGPGVVHRPAGDAVRGRICFDPPPALLGGAPMPSRFDSPTAPSRRPAWYRRLPVGLQRVAAASDRVPTVPLRAGPALRGAVGALPAVLATGRATDVQALAQRSSDDSCLGPDVPRVRVRVLLRR